MGTKITRHTELEVYEKAFAAAMKIFELSKTFPKAETYSLTDQVRRASRSVCANLAEGWRKRRYEGAFVSKLSDAEFAVKCGYLQRGEGARLYETYDEVLRILVDMVNHTDQWLLRGIRR